jgi:hypothetical protein
MSFLSTNCYINMCPIINRYITTNTLMCLHGFNRKLQHICSSTYFIDKNKITCQVKSQKKDTNFLCYRLNYNSLSSYFKECHPVVLFITEIKSKSIQTQLNSIYYTKLHVSTYFRSSSGSQFVLKHIEEGI